MSGNSQFPTRKRLSFSEAKRAFNRGENVTDHLRRQLSTQQNTPAIIEMAYDIQAGTYVKITNDERSFSLSYAREAADILSPYVFDNDVVLDVGCGELTTLSLIANNLEKEIGALHAFDISWSRIKSGLGFATDNMKPFMLDRLRTFTADMSEIPMMSKSVDVTISSHAIEPNGGREEELLREIFRVTRRTAVLFEPSYEMNSTDGRKRMDKLGYVRNLGEAARNVGGREVKITPLSNFANPLNPTAAYIIQMDDRIMVPPQGADPFTDPGDDTLLQRYSSFFFSPESGLSYPIIAGIPILRSNAAVLTSAMAEGHLD